MFGKRHIEHSHGRGVCTNFITIKGAVGRRLALSAYVSRVPKHGTPLTPSPTKDGDRISDGRFNLY